MFGRAHSYQGHVNGRDLVIPECIDAVVQVVHMLAESSGALFSRAAHFQHTMARPCTLHPTPYTLHSTPYTLHPTPTTLHRHPVRDTLHPTSCSLHPTPLPYTPHPTPYNRRVYLHPLGVP